jgi:hypothetical protein
MKYKIRGTFEVEFNSENADSVENVLSDSDRDELAVEWLYNGCGLISEELVPNLIGHSVRLASFDIVEVQ